MNTLNGMIACAALSIASGAAVSAQQEAGQGPGALPGAPAEWRYDGRLLDRGAPVSGTVDLSFRFYDAAEGGALAGPELFAESVPVESGNFHVVLETGTFAFDPDAHWIELSVDGQSILPRHRLLRTIELDRRRSVEDAGDGQDGSAPGDDSAVAQTGAFGAGVLRRSAGSGGFGLESLWDPGDPEDEGDEDEYPLTAEENYDGEGDPGDGSGGVWDTRGSEYYYKRANVGVGTSNPAYPLDVRNNSRSRTLNVDNSDNSGTRYGVYARARSTRGRGVYGYASASSGSTFGVYGRSASVHGTGVYGLNSSGSGAGAGVYGRVIGSGVGVRAEVSSPEDLAAAMEGVVRGTNTGAGQWTGLIATVDVNCEDGTNFGVFATAVAGGISNTGVEASAGGGEQNYGVKGSASGGTGSYGVHGSASGGSSNYGVYGSALGSDPWAGWFNGNVRVTGTFNNSVAAFEIDHPLDPENRCLRHPSVNSSDMMNIYNGNVVTDAYGYATITMPEWFETLNRDFRYQLTVIDEADGDGMIWVRVVRKIAANQFTIRASAPWSEVSWQVTGIRQDPFANANRIPVEQDKLEQDRGAYLHPEAWGRPEARRIGALEHPGAAE